MQARDILDIYLNNKQSPLSVSNSSNKIDLEAMKSRKIELLCNKALTQNGKTIIYTLSSHIFHIPRFSSR